MQVLSKPTRGELIRQINDRCRHSFTGCLILLTTALDELEVHTKALVLHQVRTFKDFNDSNDTWHEHDLGFFELNGDRYFWKFDYFAPDMQFGSDDPSDIEKTRRVLTVGFASDY